MAKKRKQEEQKAMYESWRQSGLTGKEFCRLNHISTRSIWKWQKKFGPNVTNSSGNKIIQTQVAKDIKFYPISEVNNNNRESSFLEVRLASGASCKAYLSENSINIFLRELLR